MPEIGEVRRFGDRVRVYVSMWVGRPPTRRAGWGVFTDASEALLAQLDELPDGAVVDVPLLQKGTVAVVSRPVEETHIDDETLAALEREAEIMGKGSD